MKKSFLSITFLLVICSLLISCFGNYGITLVVVDTRTSLMGTNIIGIAGEPADEPYIEIIYSVADDENPGFNKTASIMVSPPYIFQNDKVYVTYEVMEDYDSAGPLNNGHIYKLKREFEEGGAEYLRIINHSQDKSVEFFISDILRLKSDSELWSPSLPGIEYNNVPVYYLFFPEKNPSGDFVTEKTWNVDEVAALFKAEYSKSDNVKLLYRNYRLIDLINGKPTETEFQGRIFYGTIVPEESLHGNEKIWLMATPILFKDNYDWE